MISTEEKFVFQKIVTGIILLFSVCLLVIAWPRSRAALDFLPAKYALEKINKNEVLEEEDIATALEQTEQSAGIFADPRYSEGMSQLLLLDAQNNESLEATGKESLALAKESAEQALSLAPANALLWYRLAVLNGLLNASPDEIKKALLMSMMTGPNEMGIMLPRLHMSLVLFALFEDDDKEQVINQIITVWTLSPAEFLPIVKNNIALMDAIKSLLTPRHTTELSEMEKALEEHL